MNKLLNKIYITYSKIKKKNTRSTLSKNIRFFWRQKLIYGWFGGHRRKRRCAASYQSKRLEYGTTIYDYDTSPLASHANHFICDLYITLLLINAGRQLNTWRIWNIRVCVKTAQADSFTGNLKSYLNKYWEYKHELMRKNLYLVQ